VATRVSRTRVPLRVIRLARLVIRTFRLPLRTLCLSASVLFGDGGVKQQILSSRRRVDNPPWTAVRLSSGSLPTTPAAPPRGLGAAARPVGLVMLVTASSGAIFCAVSALVNLVEAAAGPREPPDQQTAREAQPLFRQGQPMPPRPVTAARPGLTTPPRRSRRGQSAPSRQ
jgi:hypothetical protein